MKRKGDSWKLVKGLWFRTYQLLNKYLIFFWNSGRLGMKLLPQKINVRI